MIRPWTRRDRSGPGRWRCALDRWDDYLELFGAFEGPGLLPYAVAAFFAQGGRRAYVVRIVTATSRDEAPVGCTAFELSTGTGTPARVVRLRARNEGTWGDRLAITMTFTRTPFEATSLAPGPDPARSRQCGTGRHHAPDQHAVGQPAALAVISGLTRAGRRPIPDTTSSPRWTVRC